MISSLDEKGKIKQKMRINFNEKSENFEKKNCWLWAANKIKNEKREYFENKSEN